MMKGCAAGMDKDTERESAAYVEQLLMEYYAGGREGEGRLTTTYFDAMTFLMADLMHYCNSQDFSYNAVVNAARWHYQHDNFKL